MAQCGQVQQSGVVQVVSLSKSIRWRFRRAEVLIPPDAKPGSFWSGHKIGAELPKDRERYREASKRLQRMERAKHDKYAPFFRKVRNEKFHVVDPFYTSTETKELHTKEDARQICETYRVSMEDSQTCCPIKGVSSEPLFLAAYCGDEELVKTWITLGGHVDLYDEDGFTALHVAAENGHLAIVRLLVEAGAAINHLTNALVTPIYLASQNNHGNVVGLLLELGAVVDQSTAADVTPLYIASQNGHKQVVQLLVESGADLNKFSGDGVTSLYIASQNCHQDVVKFSLEHGADIHHVIRDGITSMHTAAYHGHGDIVQILSQFSGDLNQVNDHGATPLYLATLNNQKEMVRLLISQGARIDTSREDGVTPLFLASMMGEPDLVKIQAEGGGLVNQPCHKGISPMFAAAYHGYGQVIRVLSEFGGDVTQAIDDGNTPLHIAAENGHRNVLQLLLQLGAEVNQCREDGTSALYVAAQRGHKDIVHLLAKLGVDVNLARNDGTTPIFAASQNDEEQVVRLLAKLGGDVNQPLDDGATPLHAASENGHREVIRVLCRLGGDINAATKYGATPVHYAVIHGRTKVLQLLADLGADLNRTMKDDATPLHVAAERGQDQMVRLLTLSGADVNQVNNIGATPLSLAAEAGLSVGNVGHFDVARALVEGGADVNHARDDGATPMFLASRMFGHKMINCLSDLGGDLNLPRADGSTPLHQAAGVGHRREAELLLQLGCQVDPIDNRGQTPLFSAVISHKADIAELIARSGADLNHVDHNGHTAIVFACTGTHEVEIPKLLKILVSLVNLGADIDHVDCTGSTPIYFACKYGAEDLVRAAHELGADIEHSNDDQKTPLLVAIESGQQGVVEYLVKQGASVNQASMDGRTPILLAAQEGHWGIVKYLAQMGAPVNEAREDGLTPMLIAAIRGHPKVITVLSELGGCLDEMMVNAGTPLYLATQNKHELAVRSLIENGAMIDKPGLHNQTPLHLAIQKEYHDIAQCLVQAGADKLLLNATGKSCFDLAEDIADMQSRDRMLDLLRAPPQLRKPSSVKNITASGTQLEEAFEDTFGLVKAYGKFLSTWDPTVLGEITAAMKAFHKKPGEEMWIGKHSSPVDRLGDAMYNAYDNLNSYRNAKIDQVTHRKKASQNYLRSLNPPASSSEKLGTVEGDFMASAVPMLAEAAVAPLAAAAAAKPQVDSTGEETMSDLHRLLLREDLDIETFRQSFAALMKAGTDLTERTGAGNTVLHAAIYQGHAVDIIEELLQTGEVDVNMTNSSGWTPLHVLMSQQSYSREQVDAILQKLRHSGVDISSQNDVGDTALHLAVYHKQSLGTIEWLLKGGAVVNMKNKSGRTAMHMLMHQRHHDSDWVNTVLTLLGDHGGEVSMQDQNGDTVLHIAVRNDMDISIIRLLTDAYKVDVNAVNKCQQTALHLLMSSDLAKTPHAEEMTQVLVERGADLSLQDHIGNPTLHLILLQLSPSAISSILAAGGVDAKVVNRKKETVLHLLLNLRLDAALLETMLTHGADASMANSGGFLPLHLAMYKDSIEAVRLLIAATPDLNHVTGSGLTALHCACENRAIMYIQLLSEAGADPNVHDQHGNTPLHMSTLIEEDESKQALVEALIKGGADPHILTKAIKEGATDYGFSVLHLAVTKGDILLSKRLIELGASVNQHTRSGKLPLHLASEKENVEIPKVLLVEKGDGVTVPQVINEKPYKDLIDVLIGVTNVDSVDEWGRTPLHVASTNRMFSLIPLLLRHNADSHVFNKNGWLPLHLIGTNEISSESQEREEIVAIKALLEATGDVNAVNPINGWTALHCAADAADCGYIKLLLLNKATADKPNKDGYTALQLAAQKCHTDAIRTLISMGADVNQLDGSGKSLLDLCVENKDNSESHVASTVNLLACHISLNVSDRVGLTPLHHAIQAGAINAVKALITVSQGRNADILSRTTQNGDTAVHLASMMGCKAILQLLVSRGGDVSRSNHKGQNAMHAAAISGSDDAGRFLLAHDVPVDVKDADARTPLDLAASHGHQQMTCLLLRQYSMMAPDVVDSNKCITAITKTHNLLVKELQDSTFDKCDRATIMVREFDHFFHAKSRTGLEGFGWQPRSNWYRSLINSRVGFDLLRHLRQYAPQLPSDAGYRFAPILQVDSHSAREILNHQAVYSMGRIPRGRAIILNNCDFDKRPPRLGSQHDVHNLQLVLKQLDFNVELWQNLTAGEMLQRIEKERKNGKHEESDAFVLALMTHSCNHGYLYGTDDEGLHIRQDIIDKFDQANCPALTGKPKIIIVQACNTGGCTGVHTIKKPKRIFVFNSTHRKSDIIVIHSTYPGYAAVCDEQYGSWFLEELVLTLELFAHENHLEAITRKARGLLKLRESYNAGKFQLSELSSNMAAKVYFLPGYQSQQVR